jgi:hypothetical protein
MLDQLKAVARHAIIAALPAVAAYVIVLLQGLQTKYAADAAVGSAITIGILFLTPLTRQYGVGKRT